MSTDFHFTAETQSTQRQHSDVELCALGVSAVSFCGEVNLIISLEGWNPV